MTRPSVFIGSSAEGLAVAKHVQLNLDYAAEVTVWSQGVFGLSDGTLSSLLSALERFDFGVFALTPDDLIESRGDSARGPRDNVLLELGMFLGRLGSERTFVLHERGAGIRLPSDLAGVTMATYEMHSTGNLESSLGAPCTRIETAVKRLGARPDRLASSLDRATDRVEETGASLSRLVQLIAKSRKIELQVIQKNPSFGLSPEQRTEVATTLSEIQSLLDAPE